MKFSKKIVIAAVPAVMALASTNVDSKILLMSQEGWEVSFDGAANAFIMQNSGTNTPTTSGGTAVAFDTTGGIVNATNSETSIVTGLLPNVWGMTLKAPTANGLDISARLGLYTHMNGGENALGNGQINIRETSGSVSGSFGTVLIGRSLGIHQSNAILNDMLLFGVGAGASAGNSNTTLGRIGLGYLPQQRSVFNMSVYDNILGIAQISVRGSENQKSITEKLLDEFNLQHLRTLNASVLSGGEIRRLMMARIMINKPKIVLLDEPLAALDPLVIQDIQKYILKIQSSGTAILVTDHNVKNLFDITDRSYVLGENTVIAEGTSRELLKSSKAIEHYFGSQFS